MKLVNCLRLMLANLKLVYKSMIFRLVCFIVIATVMYVWFFSLITDLFSSESFNNVIKSVKGLITITESDSIKINSGNFTTSVKEWISHITNNATQIVITSIGFFLLVILYKFLTNLSVFALGKQVGDYMSTLTNYGHAQAVFSGFGKNCLFSLAYTLINTFLDLIIFLVCLVFLSYTIDFLTVFCLPIVVILAVLTCALKLTLLSKFMPTVIVGGKKISDAFADSFVFEKGTFVKTYLLFVSCSVVIYFANAFSVFASFGAGLVITIPLSYMLIVCAQMVVYFTVNKKKYYIDYDNIVVPKELRDKDVNLLNGIEID